MWGGYSGGLVDADKDSQASHDSGAIRSPAMAESHGVEETNHHGCHTQQWHSQPHTLARVSSVDLK